MISRTEVEAAWGLIRPQVRRTPVIELAAGSLGVTAPLALKLESLQVSGSFKGRGAFHKLLASKVPAAGIVAASGGNHGAAAAYAARALGHKAEIFVPTIAAPAKVARLRSYGAVVHQIGPVYAEARAASEARAAETGALIVPAYEDEVVFAGAGSVALEFAEQAAFDTLLIAVGGGGLIAGCAAAIGSVKKIVAVETEGTPTLHAALKAEAGRRRDLGHRRRRAGCQPHRHAQLRTRPHSGPRVRAGHRRCRARCAARAVGRTAHRRRTGRRHRPRRAARRRVSPRAGRTRGDADLRRQHRSKFGDVSQFRLSRFLLYYPQVSTQCVGRFCLSHSVFEGLKAQPALINDAVVPVRLGCVVKAVPATL